MVKYAYNVLLTRGIKGTYVYVCDRALREYLRPMFPAAPLERESLGVEGWGHDPHRLAHRLDR